MRLSSKLFGRRAPYLYPQVKYAYTYIIHEFTFSTAERCNNNVATRRASSRGIIPRAKVKTVKMTFVIVIVFILCWSPYIIFDLLQVFGRIPKTQTNIAIATFIQSLAPLNSAANPLIYCVFSSQVFRTLRLVTHL